MYSQFINVLYIIINYQETILNNNNNNNNKIINSYNNKEL